MHSIYTGLFCFIFISCNDGPATNKVVEEDSVVQKEIIQPSPEVKKDAATTIIKKQPRASDNEHWKKKKAEGVNFMVIGNEPFWNLEIRNQKSLKFHLSDWEQPVEIPFTGKVESSKFNELSAKDIEVRILPEECSDGMSDFGYDYSVTVRYKGVSYKGCGIAL